MVAVPQRLSDGAGSAPVRVPATLEATDALGRDWRDRLAWPDRPLEADATLGGLAGRQLDAVRAVGEPPLRTVLLIARTSMRLAALLQLAQSVAREQEAGLRLEGAAELDVLRGVAEAREPGAHPALAAGGGWTRHARLIARTASWTPWWRLPRALLAPQAIAFGHNGLLRAHVRRAGGAVRLERFERLFAAIAARQPSTTDLSLAEAAAEQLLAAALDAPGLAPSLVAPLRRLLLPELRRETSSAALLARSLAETRRLPVRLLIGSAGGMESRALGLEVLRRGGTVTRFDHGGSSYLLDAPDALALREFAVGSTFAVASPMAAAMPPVIAARDRVDWLRPATVRGEMGDPELAAPCPRGVAELRRPRVMYVATALYRLRQVHPPVLPAPIYLDWQMRLLAILRGLPVEVFCRPHPEGDARNRPSPLGALATVANERFETAVAGADRLVFDYPATTTLSVALCTDRPIVLIDHGTMRFNTRAGAMIRDRCRIVRARWNDRNLPEVDSAELEDAVCGGPGRADPGAFRALFLAESGR